MQISGITRAVIETTALTGEMTMERALELINTNQARVPLTADQVFVFRMILSNQDVDTFHTRMTAQTLANYREDFAEGRAFMNSHRAGYFLSELPLGRTFAAEQSGTPLNEDNCPYEARGGLSLGVWTYLQRGLRLTDVSTDDTIRGIEGGTIRDVSVGFRLGDGGLYRCSICGGDMLDWDGKCQHMPGRQYEAGRCFAWIDNARAREASAVYCHSTPQAYIDKALRLVDAGMMGRRDAALLEHDWGVRFTEGHTFKAAGLPQRGGASVDWEKFLESLRGVDAPLADRLAGLGEAERGEVLIGAIREQQGQIGALKPRADMGDRWLDSLVEDTVAARVRVEADKFDADKYRKVLRATSDPAYIQQEGESWARQAKAVLGDGKRPSTTATKPGVTPARGGRNYR